MLWALSLLGPSHSPGLSPQEQKASKKKELPKELRQDPPILRVLGSGLVALEPLLVGEPLVSTVCNFGVIRTAETDRLTFLRVQEGPRHTPPPRNSAGQGKAMWDSEPPSSGRPGVGRAQGGGGPLPQLCSGAQLPTLWEPAPWAAFSGVRSPASGQVRATPPWEICPASLGRGEVAGGRRGGDLQPPLPQHPPTPVSLSCCGSFSQDGKNKNKKAKKGKN